MSYSVLAREHRPQHFKTVVGQPHVVQLLVNALTQQRLHHAYLFTGTRGVGKTTFTRILARCLNCLKGVSADPCGTCEACQAISNGQFLDVIEVDAASRTKVEDTRELLENVQYAPNQGRYKVYIIDEVHMLSKHSFNALLKTLEEPPAHVIFLLATTDPDRLPITVLSRCLQFHLKPISVDNIVVQLAHILDAEAIRYERTALQPIALAAKGSLRDALSLLDQAIAYTHQSLTLEGVNALLGHTRFTDLLVLLDALLDQKAVAAINQTRLLSEQGVDFEQVLSNLQTAIHQLTLYQTVPDLLQQNPWGDSTSLKERVNKASTAALQRYFALTLKGHSYLSLSPDQRSGFEMLLLEMLGDTNTSKPRQMAPEAASPTKHVTTPSSTAVPKPTVTTTPAVTTTTTDWSSVVSALNISGLTHVVATHCVLDKITDTTLHLILNPEYKALVTDKRKEQLAAALNAYFKQPRQLDIQISTTPELTPHAQAALEKQLKKKQIKSMLTSDSNVKSLMSEMGGQWVDESLESE